MLLPRASRHTGGEHRNRRGETLFIDARKLGHMVGSARRDLSREDIARVADTYHVWRGKGRSGRVRGRSWLLPDGCSPTPDASSVRPSPGASALGAPPIEGSNPESTERRHVGSLLKKQEGAPLNLG